MIKLITILTVGFLLSVQNPIFAQEDYLSKKVSLEQTEISFSQLRLKVETSLGLNFVFNSSLVEGDTKIQLPSIEPTLKQILDSMSKSQNITYMLKGKTILLTQKKSSKNVLKKSLNGYIKDATSGEILIGATIYLMELENGAVSNNYGYYSLTVPEGKYTARISYIGYETFSESIVIDGETSKTIELSPSSEQLEEVVVTATRNDIVTSPEVGVNNISSAQLKNQPALLGEPDLLRVLLTLPGVNNVGEGSTGFNVRGGNADQNLIILDEAPIFNSSHLFGLFSVFNSDAIKSSKLYKGIPARYGGRVSSVLDIHQKDGSKSFGGSFTLGGIIERATVEGPTMKGKGSFLVAGRLFNPLLSLAASGLSDSDNSSIFGFYDLNAKISHTLSQKNKIFLSLYSSGDQFTIDIGNDETSTLKWANQTATLRWNKIINPQLFSNFTGFYSNYNYRFEEDFGEANGKWKARISNYALKADFEYFLSSNHFLEFGIQSNYTRIAPGDVTGVVGSFSIDDSQVIETQSGLENSIYTSLESHLTKRIQVQAGLRYTIYDLLGKGVVNNYLDGEPLSAISLTKTQTFDKGERIITYKGLEPRLVISYQLSNNMAVKANYQRMYQYLQQISNTSSTLPIDIWKLSDKYVKPLMADAYSSGIYWADHKRGVQASIEGFYKELTNFIEYKNGANLYANSHLETELLNGKGKTYGIEFFLKKNRQKTDLQFAYTYSRTIRNVKGEFREETINSGKDYSSNFDQPHTLSLSIHHEINKKWSINTLFTYKTGRPITTTGESLCAESH